MAKYLLLNARIILGAYDLSGDSNSATLTLEADDVDSTTFGVGGARSHVAGLKNVSLESSGYVSHSTSPLNVDPALWNIFGLSDQVATLSGPGNDGDTAYLFRTVEQSINPFGGEAGEMSAWNLTAAGSQGGLIKGTILEPGQTARTVTGNGTGRQLGAVGASQSLYANLHVLAVSGTTPSMIVRVQSDTTSGFGAPTNRINFTAATATGAQWATPVVGPITDTWWRVRYEITGTTPSFLFFSSVGIQ